MKFAAFLTVVALATAVSSLHPCGTANAEPTDESTATACTSSTPTTSAVTTPTAPPAPRYERLPRIKKGMTKKKVGKALRDRGFVPVYKYVTGKGKDKVKKYAVSKWSKRHNRKRGKSGHYIYKEGTRVIVYLRNGWQRGVATRYGTHDNTPRNSRATASGIPLGKLEGMTFASRFWPMGTVLIVKHGRRKHRVTKTDKGGLETMDLFTTAANRLKVDKDHISYFVVRVGWHGKVRKP